MATIGHYGRVNGGGVAAGLTYYAFLAFFPIMALVFFTVGLVADVYPGARGDLVEIINRVLAGLVGDGSGQVSLQAFQDNAGKAGLFGVLGFVYAGLGWVSSMRSAMQTLFATPKDRQPNWIVGKLGDLVLLVMGGGVLLVSIVVTSAVNRYSGDVTDWLGLDRTSLWYRGFVFAVGALIGVAIVTALLVGLYVWLARPVVSHRALLEGALLAAVGFVILKLVADQLIARTHGNPAFTVFGFGLVLVVLINYLSRITMYGAAWAVTSPEPRSRPE